MNELNEKIPDPKELEKELGDFLAKKFGGNVKLATPIVMPQDAKTDEGEKPTQPPCQACQFGPCFFDVSRATRIPNSRPPPPFAVTHHNHHNLSHQ